MNKAILGVGCEALFLEKAAELCSSMLLFMITILIGRMNWRWRGEEEGETGTRGGAGAAAGNRRSKKAQQKLEG